MTSRRSFLQTLLASGASMAVLSAAGPAAAAADFPVSYTDAEWRARLTADQYLVLRQNATEAADSSPLAEEMGAGIYHCVGCTEPVYSSETKFPSDSGWPAFTMGMDGRIARGPDPTYGALLTEVHCTNCGSHMGHIFNDGPEPLGERHCINGLALDFRAA